MELEFDEGAVAAVAEQALLGRTGARAVRAILEEVLRGLCKDAVALGQLR